jgi:hypothetical protein
MILRMGEMRTFLDYTYLRLRMFSRRLLFSTQISESENGGIGNIFDLDNILRLKYVQTEKILSSPILGLGYLS